ncbi:MAG TPA: serine/threonine-protein kinase [Woeseiaceae bacterium]|nr:serine/threonine-protein kinase [Woeseiaceae bacterium]
MIIDGQAEFRSLLQHHIATHWPDAAISDFDPVESGHLPDEFSGAGNDVILLGNRLGDRQSADVVRRFRKNPGFPPIVFFGTREEAVEVRARGAEGCFPRQRFSHDALIVRLSDILVARRRVSSTGSLFVGDKAAGVEPLIKGYRFLKKLGASSHSSVYLAEREKTGVKMVLKVLRQIPDVNDASIAAFDRFLQEYEMIADIDHPNIVKIYDLGVADDHAHIAMEYLDAGDLRQRISEKIYANVAVKYLREIASALARIHEVGILHRDLKPGNIMLRRDNSIALIDFGLAKRLRLQMEITGSGEIFGTPYYMSPEQGHGNPVDERSDIYSLGVIFYEMLTGEKPYQADNAMGIIYRHAQAPIPLLPARFAEYQSLLNMMLAKNPEDRLQSVADVEEWL